LGYRLSACCFGVAMLSVRLAPWRIVDARPWRDLTRGG